jgi:hypothetical protein
MTHATAEQIHDHVCGFLRSDHVDACADCGRAAEVVGEEFAALRDVLRDPTPLAARPRATVRPPAVAAAALLLLSLSWLLFQPHVERPIDAPLASQDSEIQRLIGELQSRSPLRQEIARLALKKYLGAGVEAMKRAQVDPLFIDEVCGVTDADRAVIRKMKTTALTMEHERILYTEVLYELEKTIGTVDTDFSGSQVDTAYVKINVRNGTVQDAVEQMAASLGMPYRVMHGRLVIGKQALLPGLGPVRVRLPGADPARHIPDLGSDDPKRRDAASAALRRLGFGAEPALWEALDAESLEIRSRASTLLKALYAPPYHRNLPPVGMKQGPPVTLRRQNQPIAQVVTDVLRHGNGEYSIVWDTRTTLPDGSVTFEIRDLVLDGALRLLLQPHGFGCSSLENCTYVAGIEGPVTWTPPPHVLWMGADEARKIEPLLEGFASSDPARRDKAIRGLRDLPPADALEGLACAAGVLEGDLLLRCQRLRREIAETQKTWIQDIPSGAELQTLTPAQKAALETAVVPSDQELTLGEILRKAGVRGVYGKSIEGAYRIQGKGPKLSTLLKLVLRSQGYDFYLEGDAVVIDTAANVRAAVEK